MWFLLLYLQISAIQGLNVALRGSNSPCKGRLEVRNAKGQWGLVCHHGWKTENGQVVCKSLKCGDVEDTRIDSTLYKDPPPPEQYLMDQVNCISNEASLWECPSVVADNIKCKKNVSPFIAVECTGDVQLSLNLNGQRDKCAGVVEYSTQDGIFGVCRSTWNGPKADKICQELDCGAHYLIPNPGLFKEQQSKENVLLNCGDKDQFSWQCMELSNCVERASVICSKHKMFRLRDGNNLCSGVVEVRYDTNTSWVPVQEKMYSPGDICTQLNCGTNGSFTNDNNSLRLTCSDNVKLHNFTSKCFGDVNIHVNGSNYGVCYSDRNKRLGEQVCKELGCGGLLDEKEGRVFSNGLLSNVECLGDEVSLWHCLARHEIKQCKATTVTCAGSLDVRLSDGLGRCSGRVELQWEGSWKSISSKEWTNGNSDIVCEHLKCGKFTRVTKLFIEGQQNQLESPWHFKCESSSAKLYECLKKKTGHSSSREPNVQIMCQKEELLFFEGDSPCKGRVLKSFDGKAQARPLPVKLMADNKTEANDICHAMQCGDVVYSEKQNGMYVNVTCSGSVSVTLRNKPEKEKDERCWGTVEVCKNGKCGGVCRDTWKIEDSTKICVDLGCGKPIQTQLKNPIPTQYSGSVNHYSVYCLNEVKNINMCRFIPNTDSKCNIPAQVICTDSVKAKLEDPRDKCAGTVSLFYTGKFTPVCKDSLTKDVKNAICRELNCGQFKPNSILPDTIQDVGLSGIQCNSDANSVSKCNLEGISEEKCIAGYLQCTEQQRLLLYERKGSCSGPVYALSGEKTQLVSGQGWDREEGQKMCEYLQCGNYRNVSHPNKSKNTKEWWSKTYNCSGKMDIWECERDDQAPQHAQLNIECDDIHPPITLSKNCTGEVRINEENVCDSNLDDQMYSELCDNLDCGTAFHHWSTELQKTNWHFSCTGKETLLWQCGFKKGRCNKILSVACQKGIEFGSTEKCGGKLVVKYGDQWEYVCKDIFAANTTQVCEVLNCTKGQKLVAERGIAKEIKVTIKCPEKYQYISQCVQHVNKKCTLGPVEIKCEGYKEIRKSTVNSGLIVGLSLGMLGLLIMVFMWMNRKRLLLVFRNYRNKNGKDINIDRNEMNNMEREDRGKASSLEYEDYEDVDSVNKMGEEDVDDRSEDSSGTEYDDIEGQNSDISPHQTHADDDLPLLPKRSDNILADQDTYEVETEKQEDYDDVMPVENAGMADTQAQVDVSVNAGTDSEAGTGVNADAVVVTTEIEVHAEQE
ncbi:scavenger receptor cysteine-rich type 1 protein M130 [Siphateles boraxobius]|uniref:scavenger receptor cysteine-rich type 1 protein M130 n=1 Tax=Siphateles boraxobius TaxID=180520 RepID=UPI004062AA76